MSENFVDGDLESGADPDSGTVADESAFGVGGETSAQADEAAAHDGVDDDLPAAGGADGGIENSHAADVDAGFDDTSGTGVIEGDLGSGADR